jgi:PAS domain-containing protein
MRALPASTQTPAAHARPGVFACTHAVQFYQDNAFLVETVARHISPSLANNGAAVVIATKAHREAINDELALRGIDWKASRSHGRYFLLDAKETLEQFMVNDWPDEARFEATVGSLISQAEAAGRPDMQLPCFGEMVALLWKRKKREAAVRLEQLWNFIGQRHAFSLLCAYPLSDFGNEKDSQLFFNICGEHTHVNPEESYPGDGGERRRRRAVASLQRENRVLRNEIRLSQERVLLLQRATQSGTWEMDVLDETFSFSSKTAAMLGLPFGPVNLATFAALMRYSGDRDNFLDALKRARTGRKEFAAEFRIDREGQTRVLSIRGKTYYNHGQPVILGIISDVTPVSSPQAA